MADKRYIRLHLTLRTMTQPANSTAITPISDVSKVLDVLETIVLGKRPQLNLAVACMLARGHLLIEDVPGTGKTTLAHSLGKCLGLKSTRVQFTSDLLPADIVGVSIFNSNEQQFEFRQGPVFTSVLLADEINRAPPKAQSALLEAMEERQVSVDGNSYALPEEFFVIATQNPTDQLGAFPLPESQLDRFLVGIELGYPAPEAERALMESGDKRIQIEHLQAVSNKKQLEQWVNEVSQIHVSASIFDYIQALLLESRTNSTGLSSRAGLNLVKLSRAVAFLAGRDHVLPDDVQLAFPALAGHRLTGKVSTGRAAAQQILDSVAAP